MTIQQIPISQINDNLFNPRSTYDPTKIQELASSIEKNGLLEIPKARKVAIETYELAYGGYRLRAFKMLSTKDKSKWGSMPLDIIDIPDTSMAIFALEENLKRNTMSRVDTARAVAKYLQTFPNVKEQELAEKLSLSQGTVSNMVRVVMLPKEVLKYIDDEFLTFTMGRELCTLSDIDGLTKGKTQSKQLMIDCIGLINTEGYPATVAGMKKAIHKVVNSTFLPLAKDAFTNPPVFDVAECQKCEKSIKTTDESGKVAYHCIDSECWNLKQQTARRHLEEEALAKVAEEKAAREKADQEEAAKPADISQEINAVRPHTVKVDATRLVAGGDIFESWSAMKVIKGEDISNPFKDANGLEFVSIGDYEAIPGAKQAYRLLPKEAYSGEVKSFTPREGESNDDFRARLKSDPLGSYNGAIANRQGKEYILIGPPVVFVPGMDEPETEAKPVPAPSAFDKATEVPVGKDEQEPETKEETEEAENEGEEQVEKPEEQHGEKAVAGVAAAPAPIENKAQEAVALGTGRYSVTCTLDVVIDNVGLDRDKTETRAISTFINMVKYGTVESTHRASFIVKKKE